MCGDRAEQDEVPDVLTVGVALGDAGMRYDSSLSCFYQRKGKKKYTGARERKTEEATHGSRNTAMCLCVHACYVRAIFETSTGSHRVGEVFFLTVMERLVGEPLYFHSIAAQLLSQPDCVLIDVPVTQPAKQRAVTTH